MSDLTDAPDSDVRDLRWALAYGRITKEQYNEAIKEHENENSRTN